MMRFTRTAIGCLTVALSVAASGRSFAQAETPACPETAGLYATDKGIKIWVTRQGVAERENPLLPLSRERLVVLQVVVNGKLATAYGTDAANLRQGGAPSQLERDLGTSIRWEQAPASLPGAIRVVAEDGGVLLGPVAFASCQDAPAVKAAPASPKRADSKTGPTARGASSSPAREPPGMPQGAMQGLTLPGSKAN